LRDAALDVCKYWMQESIVKFTASSGVRRWITLIFYINNSRTEKSFISLLREILSNCAFANWFVSKLFGWTKRAPANRTTHYTFCPPPFFNLWYFPLRRLLERMRHKTRRVHGWWIACHGTFLAFAQKTVQITTMQGNKRQVTSRSRRNERKKW
jgi:hypothetical protein